MFELYYVDLATGLRRGELLGLKWTDIDPCKGIIHIRRQILRQNGKVVEAPLKTKNPYRNIAIGADTIEVFSGMKRTDEYVFPSPNGGPMSPDSVLHMFQRVLKRAGLERIRFHDLRHTFSVLALQNGVPEILLRQPGCPHGDHPHHGSAVQLLSIQRKAGTP